VDQAKGAAKETWGKAKNAVQEVHQSHTNERRNKISQSVQDAKEKANDKIDEFKECHSA
jgi:uncharacterized protein YjbJ (UPF0337 family)